MRRACRIVLAVLALTALPASPAASADARRALADGLTLFAARNYEQAARRFEEAAGMAAGEGLDSAIARFDLGCALLKAGKAAEAATAFAEASRSRDARLAAMAHHNRGVALAAAAEAAEAASRLERALALLDEALGSYESAMRADAGDEDPKVNHELVSRNKARLEQRMREQEQQEEKSGQPPPQRPERAQEPQQVAPQRPPATGNEMRPDEARTMLDAMRQQEMSQRGRMRPPGSDSAPVEKAW